MAVFNKIPTPVPTPPQPKKVTKTLPSSFIGPVKPGQTIGGVNPIGQKAPANLFVQPQQGVLGANTFGGGVPNNSNTPVNSNLLEGIPEQPSFDDSPFNDIISQIDQLGGAFQSGTDATVQGIQNTKKQQLTDLESNKTEGEANLAQYKTQAEQDTESNINEQRRQYSEVRQGLQARYGGTTGTGAFASELAGTHSMKNIAQFRQGLQNEYSKVANLQNSLLRTYISEKTNIENQSEQLIAEAKTQLQKDLAELNIRKGQVNADKQARKQQSIENYQHLVTEIKARNTSYLRDLDAQKQQIQNSLQSKAYSMSYQSTNKLLGFYEEMARNGALSDTGLREVEKAYGAPAGILQAPVAKKKAISDTNNNGVPDDEEDYSIVNGNFQ